VLNEMRRQVIRRKPYLLFNPDLSARARRRG
jgi:hypothetical protein